MFVVNSEKIMPLKFIPISILVLLITSSVFAGVAINPNGGLESAAINVGIDTMAVEGWEFQLGGKGKATIVSDSVHSGEKALKIEIDETGNNSWDLQIINELFAIKPDTTYHVSLWAKTLAGNVTASFTCGAPDYNEFGRIHETTISSDWQQYEFTFSSGNGYYIGRLPLHFSFAGNAGKTIYIDDVEVISPILNKNGSFELCDVTVGTDTTEAEDWRLGGIDLASYKIVDNPVQDGERAISITINSDGINTWDIELLTPDVPVTPGETYNYSIWAKAKTAGAEVHFNVENPSFVEHMTFKKNIGTEWENITGIFSIPDEDSSIIRIPIYLSFAGNIGNTVYIDNLEITESNIIRTDLPIVIEAENADSLGIEFSVIDTQYIEVLTDMTESTGNENFPGKNRVCSYSVSFPDTGTYDLFAKIYVSSGSLNDDSFFYGNGLGEKDPENDEDWVIVDGLASAGFWNEDDVVRIEGAVGCNGYKWVNLSRNNYSGETPFIYIIDSLSELTQTFMIGGREDGLIIDKLAFGKSELFFTVSNLEKITPGSDIYPRKPYDEPIAMHNDKFLGNIYNPTQMLWFEEYWNQVTPENAGIWGSVESVRDNMVWSELNSAMAVAENTTDNIFRFHTLIWGKQQPNWLMDNSKEIQIAEIIEWFNEIANQYGHRINYLEVVNEPLPGHFPALYKDALGGDGDSAYDWIITAFQMARDIFPTHVKLMINDYGIVNSGSNTSTYLTIINLLKDRGLIDGIGCQAHAYETKSVLASTIKENLDRLATTGLPIQITEMDIDGLDDEVQLSEYQRVFPVFWEHPAVEGVTLWGWRPDSLRNAEGTYLINEDGTDRPALIWLRDYVASKVAIEEEIIQTPMEFKLYNNYPNPFNPTTQISFDVPVTSKVNLQIYDISGRLVQTVINDNLTEGKYLHTFDAGILPSGIYFYRLQSDSFVQTKKMMLIK